MDCLVNCYQMPTFWNQNTFFAGLTFHSPLFTEYAHSALALILLCKKGGRQLKGKIISDSKDVGSFRSVQIILNETDTSFCQINQITMFDCSFFKFFLTKNQLLKFCTIEKNLRQINL